MAGSRRLVFRTPLHTLKVLAVAIDLRLIAIDLLLLLVVGILVPL